MALSVGAVLGLVCMGFVLGLLYGTAKSASVAMPVPVKIVTSSSLQLQGTGRSPDEPHQAGNGDHGDAGLARASSSTGDGDGNDPYLLIGVISSPSAFARREMLRSFGKASGHGARRVATEFVFGDRFFEGGPPLRMQERLAEEARAHGDIVFVNGREKLPHVGKATEKSAAWWQVCVAIPLRTSLLCVVIPMTSPSSAAWWQTAPRRAPRGTRFFCKTDDDSLIHHQHLSAALAAAETAAQQQGSPHVFFSYVRWRGWLPQFRFQACGGGWGGPADAIRHIEDPKEHCELAEGPFPQGTGQLTCLSRELALRLSHLDEFESFRRVAMARNDLATPCTTAVECSKHPEGTHMWHHEDAGISYNAWRAARTHDMRVTVVHMPEKGWIWPWFSPKISNREDSSRAILMHKVTPATLPNVLDSWKVELAAPEDLIVDCSQTCRQWGWKYARSPCTQAPALPLGTAGDGVAWRGFGLPWNHSHCKIDPTESGWKCCFLSTSRGKESGYM